jgi:hypothetical protein
MMPGMITSTGIAHVFLQLFGCYHGLRRMAMDKYKLYPGKPGQYPVKKIEKYQFEFDTKKRNPWYQDDCQGETVQYAVCPACNNPIQIIVLYKRRKNSPKPYGKHYGKNVPDLADHNQDEYERCPYANPDLHKDRTKRRNDDDPKGKELLQLLREQFDRVIKIIRKITGIQISTSLAEKMLKRFLSEKGYLYIGTNECNLPWMFAYFSDNQNLYAQFLREDTGLRRSLEKNKRIYVNENGQLLNAKEKIDVHFCFRQPFINASNEEVILFEVSEGRENTLIYKENITVDPIFFSSLLNPSTEHAHRDQKLLDIAEKYISETGILLHP